MIENGKTIEALNKTNNSIFEKLNKIDKTLLSTPRKKIKRYILPISRPLLILQTIKELKAKE